MKRFFTLLCVALVSAVGFAQEAYDPTAHTCVVSGTDNLCSGNWSSLDYMSYDANDGLWKITLSAKDKNAIEFKIVYDGTWCGKDGGDANYKFQVEEPSDVLITFDPSTMLATYSGDKVKEFSAEIKYIVAAGSAGLLNGLDWKITEEEAAVNMLTALDDGYYELELKDVTAGSYNFKFVANGSWSEVQWGAFKGEETLTNGDAKAATTENGENFSITLEKGALYNVTLTLDIMDPTKPMVTATWEKAGDDVITEDVYSLAGTFNDWDKDDEGAELTKVGEGVYSFTRPIKAGTYEFKIVKNHDWSVNYGGAAAGQESDNAIFTFEKDVDVTITLDITGDPTITVSTTACSVYFVSVKVTTSKEKLKVYACYSDSWTPLTGNWPGEGMKPIEGGFVTEDELLLPKGEKLWLIFNDGDGHQTANIEVNDIDASTTLEFTLNDDWTATGIQNLAADKQGSAIYSITGQRVQKAVRGLYIQNGRKFVVK